MSQRIALIGTAGRRDDGPRLTRPVWEEMVRHATSAVDRMRAERPEEELILVSGGAAYADHLAVRLYLDGKADGLELHLPAELRETGFAEGRARTDPGRIANYYHQQFAQRTGVDGLGELREAAARGAVLDASVPGFKERNTVVAGKADQLIAYTFGPGRQITTVTDAAADGYDDAGAAGLKDGGTADTWTKASRARRKVHVPLSLLEARARQRGQAETAPPRAAQTRTATGERAPQAGGDQPVLEATMYFAFNNARRPEVTAGTTFEAIVRGERTSTTRFDNWRGTDRWRRLRPGQKVRFFEDRDKSGRAVDVTVREIREIDLRQADADGLEAWSRAEGWSVAAARDFAAKNGSGVQILYDSPELVAGRTQTREAAQAVARGERRDRDNTRQTSLDLGDTPQPPYGAPDAIRGFQGEYRWLSNFAPVEVTLDGETYPSVEHAYQAAKTLDPGERAMIARTARPGEAKRAGKTLTMRPDWDDVKLDVMADLQRQKYAQEPYRANLLATGGREIWEENTWRDRFWGVDPSGNGENHMGRIVMQVREEIRTRERGGDGRDGPDRDDDRGDDRDDDRNAGGGGRDAGPSAPEAAALVQENARAGHAATTSSLETPTNPAPEPDAANEEKNGMAETTNTRDDLANGLPEEVRERRHLEGIAQHALSIDEAARADGLDRSMAQDENLTPTRQALADLGSALEGAGLRVNPADAESTPIDPMNANTDRLQRVADTTMAVVEEISEPGIPDRVAAAGGTPMLGATAQAEPALAAFDYTVPQSEELTRAAEFGQGTRRVSRDQLERVTRQSLDFLERADTIGVDFANSPVAAEHRMLTDSLDAAGYLLPGESAARTAPLAEQSIRGSDAQLMTIANASAGLAVGLDQETLSDTPIASTGTRMNGQLARIALGEESNRLKDTLSAAGWSIDTVDPESLAPAVVVSGAQDYNFRLMPRDNPAIAGVDRDEESVLRHELSKQLSPAEINAAARTEPVTARSNGEAVEVLNDQLASAGIARESMVVVATGNDRMTLDSFDQLETALREGRDPDALTGQAESGGGAISKRQAEALTAVMEAGTEITKTGQLHDHETIRYDGKLHDELQAAMTKASQTRAIEAVETVARGEGQAPGLTPESAYALAETVESLQQVSGLSEREVPERRGKKQDRGEAFISTEKMDSAIRGVDTALQSGATVAVANIAGRADLSRLSVGDEQVVGDFTSIADVMGAGRESKPDSQVGSMNKARQVMSRAYYDMLPPSEQHRSRAVFVEPGKNFFSGYKGRTGSFISEVKEWRENELRRYIRDAQVNEDGSVNAKNRAKIASLALDDRNSKGSFHGRAIVAPTVGEAQVVREESERALAITRAEQAQQKQADRAKMPKASVSFDRDELAGVARKLEASGSQDPVTLVKRGTSLSIEHPETRTARSEPVMAESVQNMRDGYRLTKIDGAQLRQAIDRTPEGKPVQINLEADRVAAMGPSKPKTEQQKRPVPREDDGLAI